MSWLPPGSHPYGTKGNPNPQPSPAARGLTRLALRLAIALIGVPILAFAIFLMAVLLISYFGGPIRWN